MGVPLFSASTIQLYSLSEEALTIHFGELIDETTFSTITAFNELLHNQPFVGFKTTVPAYTTLTVYYDPVLVSVAALQGIAGFEKVGNYIKTLFGTLTATQSDKKERITIPICYGGKHGADLKEIAVYTKLDETEVIQLHLQSVYTVYMIGFVPGFAYMGGMDQRLDMPRKAIPRKQVPAGAVGIAGNQTGIYPFQTPGGWQILGQTPLHLFSITRKQPSLLKAGDEVVFRSIDAVEFDDLAKKQDAAQNH